MIIGHVATFCTVKRRDSGLKKEKWQQMPAGEGHLERRKTPTGLCAGWMQSQLCELRTPKGQPGGDWFLLGKNGGKLGWFRLYKVCGSRREKGKVVGKEENGENEVLNGKY